MLHQSGGGGRGRERHVPSGEPVGVDPPHDHVGVGDRGTPAPAAIAGRPRGRARALRTHGEPTQLIDGGDRAASGADLDHVDDGDAKGEPASLQESIVTGHLERARHLGLIVVEEADLGRGAAHVERDDLPEPTLGGDGLRQDGAPGRARLHEPDGKAASHLERRHPAARHHQQHGTAKALLRERHFEPGEEAGHEGPHVGVGGRRREPVVLPDLGRHVRGQRDRDIRQVPAQDLGHPPLVGGIRVAVNQADRHRLHAGVRENGSDALYRCLVERDQHRSVSGQALAHGQPEMARHEGRRPLHEQVRLLEAMLVRHLQAVAHPLGADEREPGSLALDDGVRRQRGAVDDEPHVGGRKARSLEDLMGAFEKATIRIGRGGQDLGRMALPPRFEDGVRERPPDIDGERDPAGVSWLHGPRLYRTASRSRAGKEAIHRSEDAAGGCEIGGAASRRSDAVVTAFPGRSGRST